VRSRFDRALAMFRTAANVPLLRSPTETGLAAIGHSQLGRPTAALSTVSAAAGENPKKILIIASNVRDAGDVDKTDARNNLWEVAPPYHMFVMHGFEVDFVSPQGGKLHFSLDADDVDPPGMIAYTIKFERFREKADNSLRPDQVEADTYAAAFIGGGFGPLFDVANDPAIR